VEDPGTPGTYIPVNEMNRFSRRTGRSTSRTPVFMRARPHTTRSAREFTATISGFLNDTDPGQEIIRDAMNADTTVKLRVLPDGVNGFTQDFYVGNQTYDASADASAMQEAGWELTDASDPALVLLGPIL
jgi:hypothetical protein